MRKRVIDFLKAHPGVLQIVYFCGRIGLKAIGIFFPIKKKTMVFASFGGRRFDDSPKAVYDEICNRKEFEDWELVWVFTEPEKHRVPQGTKVKIDTLSFFKTVLSSGVWVCNTGLDRGLGICKKGTLAVETWHGTPLKKILIDENSKGVANRTLRKKTDDRTIRCAQSEYDREIFQRVFGASKESFLMCDLPRNDKLLQYTPDEIELIKKQLGIPEGKKVLLYMPTYREYMTDEHDACYFESPMDLKKWEEQLGDEYVLLFRAHYAVSKVMNIQENDFIKDVSVYPTLNDLYIVSDVLLSDYSSSYFDFSILGRPMLCYAYDREEYEEKRGLYLNLDETLPCPVDTKEDEILERIKTLDYKEYSEKTKVFCKRFAPNAGRATKAVVDTIIARVM